MNYNEVKSILRKYFILCFFSVFVLVVLFAIFSIVLHRMWATIALMLLFYVIGRIIIQKITNHYIHSVLLRDLDPVKYKNILSGSKFYSAPAFYKMLGAYYSGDYQTAVDICENRLQGNLKLVNKLFYMMFLSMIYFETRNFEELKVIYDRYQIALKENEKCELIDNTSMCFMYAYLNGDYNSCKNILEKKQNTKKHETKLKTIQNSLYYAIVCYQLKQTEEAERIFEDIIQKAPKLNYALISKRYLDAIKSSDESYLVYPKFIANPNYVLYTSQQLSAKKRNRMILYVLIGLLVVASIYSTYSNKTFDTKLHNGLKSQYTSYQLIDYFPITYENDSLAIMCLVNVYDNLAEGYVVTYDGGKTLSFLVMEENLKIGTYYYQRVGDSNCYIGFQIYEKRQIIPENVYKVIEINMDGSVKYFCIEYIGDMIK